MIKDEHGMQRRVAGTHDIRMDGITDLVLRAKDASVFDIGCNRGLVSLEMAQNGARLVAGCDNYADGIQTARHIFADIRHVKSQFEVVDLTKPDPFKSFTEKTYDIILMLATYHKIKRVMKPEDLTVLMKEIGSKTQHYFGWRATSYKVDENEIEIENLDRDLGEVGLHRIHTSYISKQLGVAAIWARQ